MDIDWQLLQSVWGGNTIEAYILSIGWFIFWSLTLLLIKSIITRKLFQNTEAITVQDVILSLLSSISAPLILVISLYIALQTLIIPSLVSRTFFIATVVVVLYQLSIALQIIADYFIKTKLKDEPATQNAFQSITTIGKFFIAIIGLLFILQNVGVNVTSLIAGLGIGGIAIALAAQNVLGDLFSSFALLFDKPFVPGDFVVVGKDSGVIQKVGIKTTRIKALQGEEIVIPNTELTSARIQNFKRMEERRIAFHVGVTYDTAISKVKKIPSIIQKIIEAEENIRFSRAHFTAFGDSALLFEIVYFVTTSEYELYMNAQQSINLQIMEAFEKEKIEFAFP
ncbi:MAG: hypothetical protein QG639_535, partial [Patescibacteria group bacterium]|nr:hypothetical protein [Patescibacteria group bacterium]